MKEQNWHVYIIRCRDGRLYTGISNDVKRRVAMHNKGKGCRFTKFRYPVVLLYKECCNNKSAARRRELEVKSLRKVEKLDLIKANKKQRSFSAYNAPISAKLKLILKRRRIGASEGPEGYFGS